MSFVPRKPPSTLLKLKSFRHLPEGWHFGSGGPLQANVISEAERTYNLLIFLGLTRTNAFAGSDGEAQVVAYHRNHVVSITVEANLSFTVDHEVDGNSVDYDDGLNFDNVKTKLREIAERIWSTSGSSIRPTTTPTQDVFPTWSLRGSHPMDLACHWSDGTVPTRKVG